MKPRIALALSGGGFRASLFHIGLLRRLAELGWLERVDVISTVSGGSIIGAFLVLHWKRFLDAGGDESAFTNVIAQPFLELVQKRNFLTKWLLGAWKWPLSKARSRRFTRTDAAAKLFDSWFFNGADCSSLPENPLLVLNATSLQSIRAWRFTRCGLGDSRIGHARWGSKPLSIGTCVGCSAAFPPVFPPVRIERKEYEFSGPIYGEPELPHYALIPLNDGGVYDNSGVEALMKSVVLPGLQCPLEPADFLIVSDGGAPAKYHFNSAGLPGVTDAMLLYRVDEIARAQVTALRNRSLMSELVSGKRQGLFVSLKSEVARMGADPFQEYRVHIDPKFLIPAELLTKIRCVRTSLDRFSDTEAMALMYHAYLMTDAFLWCYRNTFSDPYQVEKVPAPKWLIEFTPTLVAEWRKALKRSDSVFRLR